MKKPVISALLALAACGGSEVTDTGDTWREAQAAFLAEDYARAEALFAQVRDPQAKLFVARCQIKRGKPQEALHQLREMLLRTTDRPMTARIHLALSDARAALGQHDEALRELLLVEDMPLEVRESVIKSDELWYRIGTAYMRTGQFAAGRPYLRDLAILHPNSVHARDAALRSELSGFGVLAGEFRTQADAGAAAARFAPEKTRVVSLRGSFALIVGDFRSLDEARRLEERLSTRGLQVTLLP